MILTDKLTFDAPKRTKEGYMAVRAKSARAGVYQYMGYEVDPTASKFKATDRVNVYRPADEVFDERSVRSFLMKPITNDHPTEPVTADNHSRLSKGIVAKAMRDGDHLAFDLVFFDAATIKDIESGKRELSNGYATDLKFEDGVAPDGTAYQAVQRSITGNHVALVKAGRAGPDCAISTCDAIPADDVNRLLVNVGDKKPMKTVIVDGHSVELDDAAAIAVAGLQSKLNDAQTALSTAQTQIGTLTASVSTKDGEIVALKAQVEDAALTPAKLDAAVAARSKVIADAKKIFPAIVADGKTDAQIRKEAVVSRIADAATMDDNAINGAFTALAAVQVADKVADAIVRTTPTGTAIADMNTLVADAEKARNARFSRYETAHQGKAN